MEDGLEVRLSSLTEGQEFALYNETSDELSWGRLLFKGVGSALVERIEGARLEQVRWSLETMVIPDEDSPIQKIEREVKVMATQPNIVSSLNARFVYQCGNLLNPDVGKQNRATELLPKILEEAKENAVVLPAPHTINPELEGHPIFTGYEFGAALEPVALVAATKAVSAKQTKAQKDEAKAAARKTAVDKAKADKAAKKPAKEPRVKVERVINDCLDGCGGKTFNKFLPGHDAKLKSLILKIERGQEDIKSLPAVASKEVEFKKGDILTGKDEKGKVTSKVQQYICTKAPVKLPGR